LVCFDAYCHDLPWIQSGLSFEEAGRESDPLQLVLCVLEEKADAVNRVCFTNRVPGRNPGGIPE
jgi:hypothetical protein